MNESASVDTMPCKGCCQPISESHAADDYDAGVPFWDHCDTCASSLLDRSASPDGSGGASFSAN